MGRSWIHENPAMWDEDKARIVGGAEPGVFDARYGEMEVGALVPGEWWRVEEDGRVVAYGWLDVIWGDAEVLLATDPAYRGRGLGRYVLARLEEEAAARGLNYLYNVVRSTHPRGEAVTAWLRRCGFHSSEDGRLMRSAVRLRASALFAEAAL